MDEERIIINADDFGFSHSITDAIVDFFRLGYCNFTTVMINSNDYVETYELANDVGIIHQVGLHLNLTVGVPITDRIKYCPSFCQKGLFYGYKSNLLKRFILSDEEKSAVEAEIRAQIERYLSIGYRGLSLDSHQGVHFDSSVYPIVIKLFKEYGFNRIRRAPNINVDMKRSIIRTPFNYAVKKADIYTTDYLGNFYGIKNSCINLDNKTLEIMCHPQKKNETYYIDGVAGLLLDDYLSFLQNSVQAWRRKR